MTNKSFEKLISEIRKVTLDPAAKAAIRQELLDFIKSRPVREVESSRPLSLLADLKFIPKPMAIFLVIVILVSGGVATAAEGSLPGDALYPIKVGVNEEVRAWFNFSAEAKADLDARMAVRRLEEAEQLAASSRLNADTRAELEAKFTQRAERVRTRIADLQARGNARVAAELTSQFEYSLRAHETILTELGKQRENVQVLVSPLLLRLRSEVATTSQARAEAEAAVIAERGSSIEAAARGKLNAAEQFLAQTRAFIERRRSSLNADVIARAETQLALADQTIVDGKGRLDAGAYGEAFILFDRALRYAQQVKLLVAAYMALDISVKLDGLIDTKVGESRVCIQVITRARNPGTGETRDFPTPCDVPNGWEFVPPGETEGESGAGIESESNVQTEVNTRPGRTNVETEGDFRFDFGY